MINTILNPHSARDVLYEFALAKDRPDADLLEEFIRRYPQFAEELTDFAVSVALEIYVDGLEPIVSLNQNVSPVVSRAMSRFHNRLFEVKREATEKGQARTELPLNPFSALDRVAIRKFARDLNASNLFVMKLRDRQIKGDTISKGFCRCVSEKLGVPVNILAAHFAAEPTVHSASRHKSEDKPSAQPKQTFEEAVRSSELTEGQQRYLLSL